METARFEKRWGIFFKEDRTDLAFYLQYPFMFILKRTLFVYVAFYLYEE
jgi:hypothetical protein